MSEKRFVETLSTGIVTDNVTGKEYKCEMRIDDDLLKLLNKLHEENRELQRHLDVMRSGALTDDKRIKELYDENEQLREHFIYLIGTALEDKECRKIYAEGLLEIFDDCANLDEAKIKIKEYLE